MTAGKPTNPIRSAARDIIGAIEAHENDPIALQEGLHAAIVNLLREPDLHRFGKKREANHIANSKFLYYDGEVSISLDEFPKGKTIPPHDHGIWEAIGVYSGRLRHTNFERLDNGSVEGFADLKVTDDREMMHGDLVIVMPPAEIHSFTAQDDNTYVITIVGGPYKPTRHYYNVEAKTYMVRDAKAWRKEQIAAGDSALAG
jgi:predicted metal-dependent enzyme (double-stranded beta helix superfamily)